MSEIEDLETEALPFTPGYRSPERPKGGHTSPALRIMRAANTDVLYSHGMGGLPRTKNRRIPSMPKFSIRSAED